MPRRRSVVWFCLPILAFAAALAPLLTRADEAKEPQSVIPANRDLPRHKLINERAKKGDVELLFIGDSITQGWEQNGKEVWQKYYEPRKAMNAGIGGDRTEHILWRLDNGNVEGLSPKLVVLMIGTNNTGRDSAADIVKGIKAVVAKIREKLPQSKLLLLAVFPRSEQPDDPRRAKITAVNDAIKQLDDGKVVHYLDIGDKFKSADGTISKDIMPDFLHLSPKGYQIWAEAIEPKVVALLGEKLTAFPKLPEGAGKIDGDARKSLAESRSGLKYRVLRRGEGAVPKLTSMITVNYEGTLADGTVFDSTYPRRDAATLPLASVIGGWKEGLLLTREGGMIELQIPPALGYGEQGVGPIPGDATLHFLVELLKVQ